MKLKLNELISMSAVLRQMKPQDMKLRYRLARNLRLVDQELRQYEEMRQELLQEHGATLEEGKSEYTLPNPQAFRKAHWELLETEVNVDLHPLTLEQAEALDLSVGAIAALGELVEDNSEP